MQFNRFKDIREDQDKTQKEVAEYLQTTRHYLSSLENGKHQMTLERALQLAEFYNVSLDWLTGRTNNKDVNR